MVFINSAEIPYASSRVSLSGPLALSLAENAFKAGRVDSAVRYLEIAFAIFDAQALNADEANALPNGG